MKFDEFNSRMHALTMAYGDLVKWNEELRAKRDEARKLAEELRDDLECTLDYTGTTHQVLPWEVEK